MFLLFLLGIFSIANAFSWPSSSSISCFDEDLESNNRAVRVQSRFGSFSSGPTLFPSSQCGYHVNMSSPQTVTFCFESITLGPSDTIVLRVNGNNQITHYDYQVYIGCYTYYAQEFGIEFQTSRNFDPSFENPLATGSKLAPSFFITHYGSSSDNCSSEIVNVSSPGYYSHYQHVQFPSSASSQTCIRILDLSEMVDPSSSSCPQTHNCSLTIQINEMGMGPSSIGTTFQITSGPDNTTQTSRANFVGTNTFRPSFSKPALVTNLNVSTDPIVKIIITVPPSQPIIDSKVHVHFYYEDPVAVCGDASCDTNEFCFNCPSDCGECVVDSCGNSVVDKPYESCQNCPQDLGYCNCGNNICEPYETQYTCPSDCGYIPSCGNGECEPSLQENPLSCSPDCESLCLSDTPPDNCCKEGYYFGGVPGEAEPGRPTADFNCTPCGLGYYASELGSEKCDECAIGDFSETIASAECQTCPPGSTTYYPESTNHLHCIPDTGHWLDVDYFLKTNISYFFVCSPKSACFDQSSHYEEIDINCDGADSQTPFCVQLKSNNVGQDYSTQHKLPTCAAQRLPLHNCPYYQACNEGYEGNICGSCSENYFRLSSRCLECLSGFYYVLFVLLLTAFLFGTIVFVVRFGRKLGRNFGAFASLLSFIQILQLFPRIDLYWETDFTTFVSVVGAFSFNFEAFQLECLGGVWSDYNTRWTIFMLAPLFFLMFSGAYFIWLTFRIILNKTFGSFFCYLFPILKEYAKEDNLTDWQLDLRTGLNLPAALERVKLLNPAGDLEVELDDEKSNDIAINQKVVSEAQVDEEKPEKTFMMRVKERILRFLGTIFSTSITLTTLKYNMMNIISANLLIYSIIYVFLVTKTLEIFDCTEQPDGRATLDAEPTLECYTDIHNEMMARGVLAVLFYVIGIPLWAFFLIFANRKRLHTSTIKQNLGILYLRYEPEFWYWEILIYIQKFLIVASILFITRLSIFSVSLVIVVLCFSLILQVFYSPFIRPLNDILQVVLSFVLMAVLFNGILIQATIAYEIANPQSTDSNNNQDPNGDNRSPQERHSGDWIPSYVMLSGSIAFAIFCIFKEIHHYFRNSISDEVSSKIRFRQEADSVAHIIYKYFHPQFHTTLCSFLHNSDEYDVAAFVKLGSVFDKFALEHTHPKNIRRSLASTYIKPDFHQLILEWIVSSEDTNSLSFFRYVFQTVSSKTYRIIEHSDMVDEVSETLRQARKDSNVIVDHETTNLEPVPTLSEHPVSPDENITSVALQPINDDYSRPAGENLDLPSPPVSPK